MKNKFYILITLIILLTTALVSSAETVRENPSLYTFSEIVQKLPKLWIANPIEVLELMEQYPDYTCWRSYDVIGCQSVNNKYSAEIFVNFQFSSEDDYAEFIHTVFTMQVNGSENVQKVIEEFWLDGMAPANIMGADFPEDKTTLYFCTDETMMKYTIHWGTEGIWLLTVDMGLIRG